MSTNKSNAAEQPPQPAQSDAQLPKHVGDQNHAAADKHEPAGRRQILVRGAVAAAGALALGIAARPQNAEADNTAVFTSSDNFIPAVEGDNTASGTAGTPVGVVGSSAAGVGVQGLGFTVGVQGINAGSGTGVVGSSGSGVGVTGVSNNGSGIGVQGVSFGGPGVFGNCTGGFDGSGPGAPGVQGKSTFGGFAGVQGDNSSGGPGVQGTSATGPGVVGNNTGGASAGVQGTSVTGPGVQGTNTGNSGLPGVQGTSGTGPGVQGVANPHGPGVLGISPINSPGVRAENSATQGTPGPALMAIGHLVSNISSLGGCPLSNSPSVTAQSAAGSGATASVASGSTDTRGVVQWTTGAGLVAGDQVQVTFAASYIATPVVMIVALDKPTADLSLYIDGGTATATHFTVAAASQPKGGAGGSFKFAFFTIG